MKPRRPLTQREILRILQQHRNVLKEFKVKRIGLFGSYAADKQHQSSDIDFLVEFEEPSFDNFMNLSDYLEKLFGKKIELLTPDGIESIRIKAVADNIKKSVVYA